MDDKNTSVLTEEQKNYLKENLGKISEKELFETLGADKETFIRTLKEISRDREHAVFAQDVSEAELSTTSSGNKLKYDGGPEPYDPPDTPDYWHCRLYQSRDIYEGGFPNCAATVDYNSWCWTNDACIAVQVTYENMDQCTSAWN